MTNLRNLNIPEINRLIELSDRLSRQLLKLEENKEITPADFGMVIQSILRSYITNEKFVSKRSNKELSLVYFQLESLILSCVSIEKSALSRITEIQKLIVFGNGSYSLLINYLIEMSCLFIARRKGIHV